MPHKYRPHRPRARTSAPCRRTPAPARVCADDGLSAAPENQKNKKAETDPQRRLRLARAGRLPCGRWGERVAMPRVKPVDAHEQFDRVADERSAAFGSAAERRAAGDWM